jgi:GH24 family phage-related lysozyme (muramidase)
MAEKDDDIAWWTKGRTSHSSMKTDSAVLKKYLPNIAQNLNIIKSSLMSLVKVQEADKKTQYFERQRRRTEDYASRYKKVKPTKEDKKVVTTEKKSFMDIIKDGLSNIFKFALLGLIAMGASKLLSLPGVMDGLKDFFRKFILAVSDIIQKGVSFLGDLLKDNEVINSITNLLKKVFTFIADGISKAADVFKNIITDPENKESIGKIIVAVIGTLFTGLMSAIDIAGKALSENQESIKNGIVTIFVKIAEGIAGAVKFVDVLIQDPNFRDAVAKIYRSVLDFFNTILNEPIGSIAGQPVNLKMAAIALGAGFILLEGVMAGLTAAIVAKSVGGSLGLPSGGGGGGTGGAAGTGGKKSLGKKLLSGLGTATNVAGVAAMGYGGYTAATQFSDASKEAKRREEERKNTTPSRTFAEGPASSEQKASAVSTAKTFTGKSSADFISSMEGFAGKAYLDPPNNTKNQYSVGFGHLITEAEIKQGYINLGNGKRIEIKGPGGKDTTITKEEAKALLNSDIPKYEAIASKGLGSDAWIKLNQDQKNALTSLAYNGGAGIINHLVKNGLREAILKNDMEAASKIIYEKGYKTSGGKYLAGLDTRRLKEATLFAGAGSDVPTQLAAAPSPVPGGSTASSPSPTGPSQTAANAPPEPPKTFGDTLAALMTTGSSGNFMKQLDEMTGGKLGVASGDLAKALRTRNLFGNEDIVDGSTNITADSSTGFSGPIPGIFDETLLSKLSIA